MSDLQNHPRITPFLWFDRNAEEAVGFYLTVFKNSRRLGETAQRRGKIRGPERQRPCSFPSNSMA